MIYTITFNPAIDYFLFVDKSVEEGSIVKTGDVQMNAGGKGVNISLVLANMYKQSKAMMFLGGFCGKFIANQIGNNKYIDVLGIDIDGESRINVKIQNTGDNKETAINTTGPVVGRDKQEKLLDALKNLEEGDFVAISGSYCKGVDKSLVKEIAELTRQAGAKLVCDVANLTLEDYKEIKPYLIKPNNDELADIFQKEVNNDNYVGFVNQLLEIGVENVLLSLGKSGSYFANKDCSYRASGPNLKAVNTVACGDSMLAFTIGQLDNGKDFGEAIRYGEAAGRVKAGQMNLPNLEQVEAMLPQITVEKL